MLAGLFKRQQRFEDAAELYRRGAVIAPTNNYMRVNRAAMELLAKPMSPELAITLYRDLLKDLTGLSSEKRDAWFDVLCGEAYFVLGEDTVSRKHFEVAG